MVNWVKDTNVIIVAIDKPQPVAYTCPSVCLGVCLSVFTITKKIMAQSTLYKNSTD